MLLLLADPFTLPVDDVVDAARPSSTRRRSWSAGWRRPPAAPGGNRLVLDDDVVTDGGVGVVLPAEVATAIVVSQGCRPVGEPLIVTSAERQPARRAGRTTGPRPAGRAGAGGRPRRPHTGWRGGLHLGIVVDEHRADFGRGDFLVRNVLGADRGRRGRWS